jgi:hypothetical protein
LGVLEDIGAGFVSIRPFVLEVEEPFVDPLRKLLNVFAALVGPGVEEADDAGAAGGGAPNPPNGEANVDALGAVVVEDEELKVNGFELGAVPKPPKPANLGAGASYRRESTRLHRCL